MKVQARLLAAILALCASQWACRDAEKWIRKLQFSPIRPPSNLLSPGAIVMRKHLGSNVRLLCTAEESLGRNFEPSQHRTVGGRMAKSRKIGWHLDADALEQIKVTTQNNSLSDVHIQISNARILSLTDVDVLLNARNRSDACAAAIRRRKASGWDVSMVASSLKADVTFGVKFQDESQMSASAKLAQLQAVSVSLGGQFEALTEQSGFAKGLSWGFRDDKALAAITTQDTDVLALRAQSPVPSKRQSIFLPEETLTGATARHLAADNDTEPTWGVSTSDEFADPVPGFDDAMQDAVGDAPPGQGVAVDQPSPADDVALPQDPAEPQPISPRSRLRQ